MKTIIRGKRYDTDAAILLAKITSAEGKRSFNWFEEALYRTPKSGVYFLAGEGHARSRYGKLVAPHEWTAGHKITPLTPQEAYEWAEQNLNPDQIEEIFPDQIEDADTPSEAATQDAAPRRGVALYEVIIAPAGRNGNAYGVTFTSQREAKKFADAARLAGYEPDQSPAFETHPTAQSALEDAAEYYRDNALRGKLQ